MSERAARVLLFDSLAVQLSALDLNKLPLPVTVLDSLLRLKGSRLVGLGRAAELQHFTFRSADGSELFLHVECPWRIRDASDILVGRADYWRAVSTEVSDEALDAAEIGSTLRDLRNAALRERLTDNGIECVEGAVDAGNGFTLNFADGLRLEVFPDAARGSFEPWEFWRVFPRGGQHFAVHSDGIYQSAEV